MEDIPCCEGQDYRCLDCNHVALPTTDGKCSRCGSTAIILEDIIAQADLDYEVVNGYREEQTQWPKDAELASPILAAVPMNDLPIPPSQTLWQHFKTAVKLYFETITTLCKSLFNRSSKKG